MNDMGDRRLLDQYATVTGERRRLGLAIEYFSSQIASVPLTEPKRKENLERFLTISEQMLRKIKRSRAKDRDTHPYGSQHQINLDYLAQNTQIQGLYTKEYPRGVFNGRDPRHLDVLSLRQDYEAVMGYPGNLRQLNIPMLALTNKANSVNR